MNQIPVVSVVMITYGQENYIREAIEGVLMQSCDFEIELIVANDCSPDNTDTVIQDIIQNNSNGCWIRYFKQEKNIGMMPNFIFALQQATSKYIALCDGDDYWTDPLKLQKQVDFLEENPDYILTHTNVLIQEESSVSKNVKDKGWNFINNRLDYRFAIFYPLAFTCSAMFRNIPFCDNSHYNIIAGDWKLWTQLTLIGKAKFMNFESSVYRKGLGVSVNSIWHKEIGRAHV